MFAVVVGHWLVTAARWQDGTWELTSPLAHLSGGWVLTVLLQVIPLFFFVGGWANATSWQRRAGTQGAPRRFLTRRWRRLAGPSLAFLGIVAAVAGVAVLAGAEAAAVLPAANLAVQPLWFLVVYVVVTSLTPAAWPLARRAGPWPAFAALAAAAAVDALHVAGWLPTGVAYLNVLLVWGGAHQLGLAHAAGWPRDRRTGATLIAAAAALGAFLWWAFAYPLEMVGVTGQPRSNMNPPSTMMVALTLWQVGAFVLLRAPLERFLEDDRRWRAVESAGRYAIDVFLWHQVALLTVTAAVSAARPLPGLTTTPADYGWVGLRLAWFPAFAAVLALLVSASRRSPAPASA